MIMFVHLCLNQSGGDSSGKGVTIIMFVGQSYFLNFIVLSLHLHQITNICHTGIIFLMMISKGFYFRHVTKL